MIKQLQSLVLCATEWRGFLGMEEPSQSQSIIWAPHDNLSRIAEYKLSSSSRTRLGTAVYNRVQYIAKKLRNT